MLRRFVVTVLAGLASSLFAAPALAQVNQDEPLPRFEDRLCPGVTGLELEQAELMVGRIRSNATRFGLQLADEASCEPNLLIGFVESGQDYLAQLVADRGHLFARMNRADRDTLLAQRGPVTVWHQIQQRTRDGLHVGTRENMTDLPRAGMWQAHSRIYVPVRNDITYALVLFDRAEVSGLTVAQLADLASLRGFATAFPDEAGAEQASLLTLFADPASRAPRLTAFDEAWLERLYSGIPNMPASVRLRGVQSR
ncbi:MAG: hypothetical protein JY451_03510 [Erythrobacter sp.]|nr:MAG: hypothetical protein JY451_03510 [Erythrobacter sp.]